MTTINSMTFPTLEQLKDRHPDGEYFPDHGCFYFLDHDGDLCFYYQYISGEFDKEPDWTDLDTLDHDERQECENIIAAIASK